MRLQLMLFDLWGTLIVDDPEVAEQRRLHSRDQHRDGDNGEQKYRFAHRHFAFRRSDIAKLHSC